MWTLQTRESYLSTVNWLATENIHPLYCLGSTPKPFPTHGLDTLLHSHIHKLLFQQCSYVSPLSGFLPLLVWVILALCSEKAMEPTPVLLPGKPHGRRSLVGGSSRDHKESDTTEQLHSLIQIYNLPIPIPQSSFIISTALTTLSHYIIYFLLFFCIAHLSPYERLLALKVEEVFWLHCMACRISLLWPGMNLCPMHLKCGALTTGPHGKSPRDFMNACFVHWYIPGT